MANVRRSSFSQQTISGGITIEGPAIQGKSVKEIEAILDRELKGLKKDLMKEVRRMKSS